jgi:subtilisin family serine protease
MITIGASSDPIIKNSLLTDFSNIGDKVVDILSPGEKIYSTLPNNNYGYMNGTSMASPIVTHIASLIRAYFPNLNAKEVKSILMQSVWTSNDESTNLLLAPSSKTAGIVNAYNAFVLADEINKKKNKKRK